jgi:UDP-glucose:(heptosyl)LPS alpha-1,3-glucosyltransferase
MPLYAQFDLLLHPARQEPYGMVIAEARAAGVPVVISDACGIAPELDHDVILNNNAEIRDWASVVENHIGCHINIIKRDWKTVAEEQLACYLKYPA